MPSPFGCRKYSGLPCGTFCGFVGEKGLRPIESMGTNSRCAFFPDARLNFAENLLARPESRRRDCVLGRGQGQAPDEMGARLNAQVSRLQQCFAHKASASATAWRPCCPTCRKRSSACSRPPRSARSGRPARRISASQGALDRFGQIEPKVLHRLRRLLLHRQDDRHGREGAAIVAGLPTAADVSDRPPISARRKPRRRRSSDGVTLDGALAAIAARGSIRAAALRPSALYPVLLRHDRRAEMHRALRRRHADAASEGASAPLRCQAGRQAVLLHHLRLDDVELAGLRPRQRRDAPALRRLALPSRAATSCSTMPTPRG